jgi:hypothetical protein
MSCQGKEMHGRERQGMACQVKEFNVMNGMSRQGMPRKGIAWHFNARHGMSRK